MRLRRPSRRLSPPGRRRRGRHARPPAPPFRRDARHYSLLLLIGCLLAASGVAWVVRTTPAPAQDVVADAPIMRAPEASPPATTTTALPTTTTAAPAAAPAAAPRPAAPRPAGPVSPPRQRYIPEPIRQIGTIEIPKIGLVHPVFEGISLTVIDHGPSHWPGTALPGQNGNTVFMGHRVTHSHPFRHIDQLVPGDAVVFVIQGARSVYRVTGHEVVTPKDLWITNQTATPTGTLFACHPPGSARYRYVVRLALESIG